MQRSQFRLAYRKSHLIIMSERVKQDSVIGRVQGVRVGDQTKMNQVSRDDRVKEYQTMIMPPPFSASFNK